MISKLEVRIFHFSSSNLLRSSPESFDKTNFISFHCFVTNVSFSIRCIKRFVVSHLLCRELITVDLTIPKFTTKIGLQYRTIRVAFFVSCLKASFCKATKPAFILWKCLSQFSYSRDNCLIRKNKSNVNFITTRDPKLGHKMKGIFLSPLYESVQKF